MAHEVCFIEAFNAQCSPGQAILIQKAFFGQMRTGRCSPTNTGHVGCVANVITQMDSMCSGLEACEVMGASSELIATKHRCPVGVPLYLEVVYECVPVLPSHQYRQECSSTGQGMIRDQVEGNIAPNILFGDLAVRSVCPIIIQVPTGKFINVTLMDFNVTSDRSSSSWESCLKYATIAEKSPNNLLSVCRGRERSKTVYISKTSRLEIRLMMNPITHKSHRFMLSWEAFGCSEPELRGNKLSKLTETEAHLRCDKTEYEQVLTCTGTAWSPTTMPCVGAASLLEALTDRGSSKSGIIGILIVGIVIGLVIGPTVMFCGLFVIRKVRKNKRRTQSEEYYTRTVPRDKGTYNDTKWRRSDILMADMSHKQQYRKSGTATIIRQGNYETPSREYTRPMRPQSQLTGSDKSSEDPIYSTLNVDQMDSSYHGGDPVYERPAGHVNWSENIDGDETQSLYSANYEKPIGHVEWSRQEPTESNYQPVTSRPKEGNYQHVDYSNQQAPDESYHDYDDYSIQPPNEGNYQRVDYSRQEPYDSEGNYQVP